MKSKKQKRRYKCALCKDKGYIQLPPAYPRLTHTRPDCPRCFPARRVKRLRQQLKRLTDFEKRSSHSKFHAHAHK